ncbi:hypothetical protein WHI96_25160 [Pseudonocardia tropica]|uniref:Integral membrane protein n=2 Tax=Pseudonocardia TaxID=1847 RepID=A0A852WDI6_PSEA5|nr:MULTISPECIES: hypothetical protein [Pseudonocardia]MBO4239872.1 hypothetical protein [Pseudonocardia alni]MCM3846694.1 hypothetical protein [Pseudonocardia sp. DR1-2]MCO7194926.1 hypothetical protein [Pseudonocardia sp. McavD-2-B]NYG03786.1 hypothetical protein [Pseudonocardia antarctica]WFG44744.1 hypothetical protein PaSha_16180 [Pseudonocardia alni]
MADDRDDRPVTRERPPENVRVAGVLVAAEGLVGAVLAVVLGVRALEAGGARLYYGLAEAGIFVLLAAAVAGVGYGLVRGVHGCRTPAIVVQLLLFPAIYYALGPSRQLVWGIVCGLFVLFTFLMLISEQSRRWSMGDEYPED